MGEKLPFSFLQSKLWGISNSCPFMRHNLAISRYCDSILYPTQKRRISNDQKNTFNIVKKSELTKKHKESLKASRLGSTIPSNVNTPHRSNTIYDSDDIPSRISHSNSYSQTSAEETDTMSNDTSSQSTTDTSDTTTAEVPHTIHVSPDIPTLSKSQGSTFTSDTPAGVITAASSSGESTKSSAGDGDPLEVPTTCCQSGCANCVWLDYAEKLSARYSDGGKEAIAAINRDVQDPNLREFLLFELRIKKLA